MIQRRFEANFELYDRVASIQDAICGELARWTVQHAPAPLRICEIGAGTGFLTRRLAESYPAAGWFINDISPRAEEFTSRYTDPARTTFLCGDAERIALPGDLDLIVSASTMQWFDDPEGFFAKCSAALTPGGVLAVSTFGPSNYREIREVEGTGLDYPTPQELVEFAAGHGLEVVHASDDCRPLSFASPHEVLRHIRATGVNSLRETRWTKGDFQRFTGRYNELYAQEDGSVPLTYHPVILLAVKR